jgi:hypothetical protein
MPWWGWLVLGGTAAAVAYSCCASGDGELEGDHSEKIRRAMARNGVSVAYVLLPGAAPDDQAVVEGVL